MGSSSMSRKFGIDVPLAFTASLSGIRDFSCAVRISGVGVSIAGIGVSISRKSEMRVPLTLTRSFS